MRGSKQERPHAAARVDCNAAVMVSFSLLSLERVCDSVWPLSSRPWWISRRGSLSSTSGGIVLSQTGANIYWCPPSQGIASRPERIHGMATGTHFG